MILNDLVTIYRQIQNLWFALLMSASETVSDNALGALYLNTAHGSLYTKTF